MRDPNSPKKNLLQAIIDDLCLTLFRGVGLVFAGTIGAACLAGCVFMFWLVFVDHPDWHSNSEQPKATREYWVDLTRLQIPPQDSSPDQLFYASRKLEGLPTLNVDRKIVDFGRELSNFYWQIGTFRKGAFEQGAKGQGLVTNRDEIQRLSDESKRIGEKLVEMERYVHDTYRDN